MTKTNCLDDFLLQKTTNEDDEITRKKFMEKMPNPFTDDLKPSIIADIDNHIQEAWKGWRQAVKFEDENLQDYYLRIVNVLSDTKRKIKRV